MMNSPSASRSRTSLPRLEDPDIDAIVAYARRAEELGFTSLWAWDHMFLGHRPTVPVPRVADDAHGAGAGDRQRAALGTGMLVLPLRGAAVLAKTAATIEIISGGRLTLGMAVGWYEREFDAAACPFRRRGRIFEENLELIQAFWTGERVSGEARGIPFRNAMMLPQAGAAAPTGVARSAATSTRCSNASPSSRTGGSRTSTRPEPFAGLVEADPRVRRGCRTAIPSS